MISVMDKQKYKRQLFFWVDRLQITKKERITVTFLLSIIIMLLLTNIVIKQRLVPTPDNHTEILAEFERRSLLIEREKFIQHQVYAGIEPDNLTDIVVTKIDPINLNTASLPKVS